MISSANRHRDHTGLLRIAKESKHTRDFGHMMFSGEDAYDKGWIRVYYDQDFGVPLGFTCVRHKKREPECMLYYICVTERAHGQGVAQALMDDLMEQCEHNRIACKCRRDNERALAFYKKLGFLRYEAMKKDGSVDEVHWKLVLEW